MANDDDFDEESFIENFEKILEESEKEPSDEVRIHNLQKLHNLSYDVALAYVNADKAYREKFGEALQNPHPFGINFQKETKLMLESLEKGEPYSWIEEQRKKHIELYGDDKFFVCPEI